MSAFNAFQDGFLTSKQLQENLALNGFNLKVNPDGAIAMPLAYPNNGNSGWVENMPGFVWYPDPVNTPDEIFAVTTNWQFLSKSFDMAFAYDILAITGNIWTGNLNGLTATDMAAECYFHAAALYFTDATIAVVGRGYDYNHSASTIDIAPNDPRAWAFNLLWNTTSFVPIVGKI